MNANGIGGAQTRMSEVSSRSSLWGVYSPCEVQ